MSNLAINAPPTFAGALRQHNRRISALEGNIGRWVYVLPVAPATPPPDYNPDDPLSPNFQNSWANSADEQPLSFRIHPATKIQIRSGGLGGGTIPSVVFTLPENYRPTQGPVPTTFPSNDGTSTFTGRVDTNGDVWILAEIGGGAPTSVEGSIAADGTVNLGPVTAVRNSTGDYTVTFSAPLSDVPIVLATTLFENSVFAVPTVVDANAESFEVVMYDATLTPQDQAFSFSAMVPA